MPLLSKTIKNTKNISLDELKLLLEKEFKVQHVNKDNSWQILKIQHNNLKFHIQDFSNDFKLKIYPPIWWNLYLLVVPTIIFLLILFLITLHFILLLAIGAVSFIIIPFLSNFIFFNKKIKSFLTLFTELTQLS